MNENLRLRGVYALFATILVIHASVTYFFGTEVDAIGASNSELRYKLFQVLAVPLLWILPDHAVSTYFRSWVVANSALWALIASFAFWHWRVRSRA